MGLNGWVCPQFPFQRDEIPETRRDPSTLWCKLAQEHKKPENEILKRFNSFLKTYEVWNCHKSVIGFKM